MTQEIPVSPVVRVFLVSLDSLDWGIVLPLLQLDNRAILESGRSLHLGIEIRGHLVILADRDFLEHPAGLVLLDIQLRLV